MTLRLVAIDRRTKSLLLVLLFDSASIVALLVATTDGKIVDRDPLERIVVEIERVADEVTVGTTDGVDRDNALEKCFANCSWLQHRDAADATILFDMFNSLDFWIAKEVWVNEHRIGIGWVNRDK